MSSVHTRVTVCLTHQSVDCLVVQWWLSDAGFHSWDDSKKQDAYVYVSLCLCLSVFVSVCLSVCLSVRDTVQLFTVCSAGWQAYHVRGQFGMSTTTFTPQGNIVERTTYSKYCTAMPIITNDHKRPLLHHKATSLNAPPTVSTVLLCLSLPMTTSDL